MRLDLRPCKQAVAPAALKLNNRAFSNPVLHETTNVGKSLVYECTTRQFACDYSTAPLPMFLPFLVLEGDCAFVAVELCVVERLHYKSIDVFAEAQVAAAIGARTLLLHPFGDARFAEELAAFLTFFRLLYDLDTN